MDKKYASLKAWRKANFLSQADAAKKLGVTQAHWCRLEAGQRRPSRRLAQTLSRKTGMTLAQLLLAPLRKRRPRPSPDTLDDIVEA